MRHLDLFSGIGGFALAASWVWGEKHEIHSFVEIEPFAQKVLKKHWPDVPIHGDIKTYEHDGTTIDLVSGGFPCQPYSVSGKRLGSKDDRALWPEMLRVIKEVKPRWVVGENVAGFVGMDLDVSLSDLEAEGYETTTFIIPACSVGAQHKRDRVWIVAHSTTNNRRWNYNASSRGNGEKRNCSKEVGQPNPAGFEEPSQTCRTMADANKTGWQEPRLPTKPSWTGFAARQNCRRWNGWEQTEPPVCGTVNGIPNRVDRINGLGNAIVPQVAANIFDCIKIIDEESI